MGNAAPRAQPPSQLDSASQLRTYLMDYAPQSMDIKLVFDTLIGDGKFLKTIHCKCDEGHLVVKIYRKFDASESLSPAHASLQRLLAAFSVEQQPNLIPYADFRLSKKFHVAFLVRQYFGANLYDRIVSRPFLTGIEKKWLAFQLLRALEQSHAKGICHGDIKQENIMVTSWNWVFLTDFAPFKPTYIPEDDPADYNYYFCAIDATRRGCSVAPERFYGAHGTAHGAPASAKAADAIVLARMADSDVSVEDVDRHYLAMHPPPPPSSAAATPTSTASTASATTTNNTGGGPNSARAKREGKLLASMDIFSAGCVIAEIFLGGKPLFDLPSLLKYRTGDSEPVRIALKKIGDARLEELLLHMLQLDPRARLSAREYLVRYTGGPHGLFPTYFDSFLFRFLMLVLGRGGKVPDARIRLVCKYYGRLVREVAGVDDPDGDEFFKLRLKEGYGSDRQVNLDMADGQTHVAQRVIEELEPRTSSVAGAGGVGVNGSPADRRRGMATTMTAAESSDAQAGLSRSERLRDATDGNMTNLSGTMQKKKIEKLHDQYNALTQKKKQSLLLDYTAESPRRSGDDGGRQTGPDSNTDSRQQQQLQNDHAPRGSESERYKPPSERPRKASKRRTSEPWGSDRNGVVIVLSLVCSSLRHCEVPETKVTAVYLIKSLGLLASDEVRLQRLVPFLLELFEDASATVRALALRTTTLLLSRIETFPLSDASIFPQYILPALTAFPSDPDELVRIAFAECLPQLAATSRRFLELAHAMKQRSLASPTGSQAPAATAMPTLSSRGGGVMLYDPAAIASASPQSTLLAASAPVSLVSNSFDKELNKLHRLISRFVIQLAAPDQKASSALVKRALLVDITRLCVFFGRERTLDVVLPQLITFLNDRDWELRGAFFDYIVGLCSFVGRVTVELYILPCIEQALYDVEEIVITKALECLSGLCQLGLFQRNTSALVDKAKMTTALLLHPSWWIRDAVLKLVVHIALQMGCVDANVFLSPLLRPLLRKSMVFLLDEREADVLRRLRDCCRPHVTRATFDAALIASSAGTNEIIAEMELFLNLVPSPSRGAGDSSDDRSRRPRDVLSSVDSLDNYSFNRVSPGVSPGRSDVVGGGGSTGPSSIEHRKNEIVALKLMQQYVSIASMHMRSKMDLAQSEQSARMQSLVAAAGGGAGASDRSSAAAAAAHNSGSGSTMFARKISRSHLRVLYVPDMRYALSTVQPLKSLNLVGLSLPLTQSASAAVAAGNSTALVAVGGANNAHYRTSPGTALVAAGHNQNQQLATTASGSAALSSVPNPQLLDNLPLSLLFKMYGLEAPSLPVASSLGGGASAYAAAGGAGYASGYDESGLPSTPSHGDSASHFASMSGGVMVSMLNMDVRDMYGGDGVGALLDPRQAPISPARLRTTAAGAAAARKAHHSAYHHYFAFKESAMDPALRNSRKLLARLTALGVPPLPPDLGALRQPDGSYYSIYSHPLSPYANLSSAAGGVGTGVGGNGIGLGGAGIGGTVGAATPGSDRGGGGSSANASVGGMSVAATPLYNGAAYGMATASGGLASGAGAQTAAQATVGGGGVSSSTLYSYRGWRPRMNVLVAELAEHTGAVHRIGAAQDFSFLASASSDGTVKLWSIRSMQHSINQGSRCTYDGQGGVLTDMRVLDNSHSVAAASSNGSVHVFRVDKVNAVGGNFHATGLKELRTEGSAVMVLDHLTNVTESLLIYATRDGAIHAWDLRMRRDAWRLDVFPELGYVTCMAHSLDVSWFAVGTSRGFICLWDLRYLVLIRIWRHSAHRTIHRVTPCVGLPNTLPLDDASVPLVFVAAGDGDVAVFDLSIGACRAVFRTLHVAATERDAARCPTLLHVPIPQRSRCVLGSFLGIYGIATAFDDIAATAYSEEPSVRALLCPALYFRGMPDALLTGGEDKQIRYWDIRSGKASYTVCGSSGDTKAFYDNQPAPADWWRMSSSHMSQIGTSSSSSSSSRAAGLTGSSSVVDGSTLPSTRVPPPAAITKPEMAWSKLSAPVITVCQDATYVGTRGSGSSVSAGGISGAGSGVESAVTMERRGLVAPSPAHTDCILDLTLVDLNGPMLVSSGRDGLIKVWK